MSRNDDIGVEVDEMEGKYMLINRDSYVEIWNRWDVCSGPVFSGSLRDCKDMVRELNEEWSENERMRHSQ